MRTSLNAGMDHEMPDAKWLNEANVKAALADTSLEIETVDRALVRRYTQMFRFGQFERPYRQARSTRPHTAPSPARSARDRRTAEEHDNSCRSGRTPAWSSSARPTFVDDACLGGGGSSKVTPLYTVPPLDGMRDVLADLGSSATVTKVTVADDLSNLDEAKRAASEADAVVLMAGLVATEGADQPDANMLNNQNRMLDQLLGLNPSTVVVLKDSNPMLMPWIDQAPAVLEVWNQGSEDGHVVADLLFGVVNPSGKVPDQYPVTEATPCTPATPSATRHRRGRRISGHPILRGTGDRLPLVPGPRHRAPLRLRLRPVLHDLRRH